MEPKPKLTKKWTKKKSMAIPLESETALRIRLREESPTKGKRETEAN